MENITQTLRKAETSMMVAKSEAIGGNRELSIKGNNMSISSDAFSHPHRGSKAGLKLTI